MEAGGDDPPDVSFVVPAKDEEAYLGETLASVRRQRTDADYDLLVVDGDSTDATRAIARDYDATVVEGGGEGRGHARHLGAMKADGRWLAFVDADTVLDETYLSTLLSFVERNRLDGAAARAKIRGSVRVVPYRLLFNYVLPRLSPPVFPGFNVVVDREAYFDVDGFPNAPNEDVTFSRRLGRQYRTATCPEVLLETSGRRIDSLGLVRSLIYYTRLEYRRLRSAP